MEVNEKNDLMRILYNGDLISVNISKNIPMAEIPIIDPDNCEGKTFQVWGKY